jgi:hypothetical protein
MSLLRAIVLTALLLGLAACAEDERQPTAEERAELMANAGLLQVEKARSNGRQQAALIYAEEILQRYPDSAAAARLRGELDTLREAAEQERESRRLAELFTYHAVEEGEATVYTAYIFGQPAANPSPELRLVLRRHPEWGQNTYLLIGDGADFACRNECRAQLRFDDGDSEAFVITRAKDVDPPALFLEEDQRVLDRIASARELELQVDLRGGKRGAWRFELGGFDANRLGPAPQGSSPVQATAAAE